MPPATTLAADVPADMVATATDTASVPSRSQSAATTTSAEAAATADNVAPSKGPSEVDVARAKSHVTTGDAASEWLEKLLGCFAHVPPDDEIAPEIYWEPFEKHLRPAIDAEFEMLGIDTIVRWYGPVVSEFFELVKSRRSAEPTYFAVLDDLVASLKVIFRFESTPLMVFKSRYTTEQWGYVFWRFMHLTSILVAHAFAEGQIQSMLNLPLIVLHIDLVLPCHRCASHYATIKHSDSIQECIRQIAFGKAIEGVHWFHAYVTQNVSETAEHANRPRRPVFGLSDYAYEYGCMDAPDESMLKAGTYVPAAIDWQPPTHVELAKALSAYCQQPFSRMSALIKLRLYNRKPAKTAIRPHVEADLRLLKLTPRQLAYFLHRALTLQFQGTGHEKQRLQADESLNRAISRLYRKHPTLIRTLLRNVSDPSQKAAIEQQLTMLANADPKRYGVPGYVLDGAATLPHV